MSRHANITDGTDKPIFLTTRINSRKTSRQSVCAWPACMMRARAGRYAFNFETKSRSLSEPLSYSCARGGSSLLAYRALAPFPPSLFLPLCRLRRGRRAAVARSAWSETSFPFHLMLPRGPKEAYLRAFSPPRSTPRWPAGWWSRSPLQSPCGSPVRRPRPGPGKSCFRAGDREGGREEGRGEHGQSVSQSVKPLLFAACFRLQSRSSSSSSLPSYFPSFIPARVGVESRRIYPRGISSCCRRCRRCRRHSIPFHSNVETTRKEGRKEGAV